MMKKEGFFTSGGIDNASDCFKSHCKWDATQPYDKCIPPDNMKWSSSQNLCVPGVSGSKAIDHLFTPPVTNVDSNTNTNTGNEENVDVDEAEDKEAEDENVNVDEEAEDKEVEDEDEEVEDEDEDEEDDV